MKVVLYGLFCTMIIALYSFKNAINFNPVLPQGKYDLFTDGINQAYDP